MQKNKKTLFDRLTQILLPVLTITGFALTALKFPGYGMAVTLLSEIFWMYAAIKAWKEAGQIGIFITTIILSVVLIYGVFNYFIL